MSEKIYILYIEDDKIVADSVSRTLQLLNQKIFTAYDGEEALGIIEKNPIDIIITDIRMPKLNGINLVEKLRQKDLDIPVIITTAFNEIDYLKKAIELSIESFIEKPIDLRKLLQTVSKISQRVETKRELERKKIQIEHFKEAISKSNLIISTTKDGLIKDINFDLFSDLSDQISKYKIEHISSLIDEKDLKIIYEFVNKYEVYNKTININFQNKIYIVNLTAFALEFDYDEISSISFIFKDISLVVREKEEIINSLYLEPITKLQNRSSLIKNINESKDSLNSLIIIDIDNFGRYIKMYGYEVGDKILRDISSKLEEFIKLNKRQNLHLFKLDSDKFAILLKSSIKIKEQDLAKLSNELLSFLESSIFLIDETINLDLSFTFGGAYFEQFDILTEALIAKDVAQDRKLNYIDFSNVTDSREAFQKNIELEKKIKNAFLNDEIITYFQAIVDKDKNIIKYEALARIYDSFEKKVLTPYSFLNNIQHSKNYTKFTKIIIKKAMEGESLLHKEISINFSYEDIINPEIIDYLEKILKQHKSVITIELLESEGLIDMEKTIKFCTLMKSYGARIAIDDFGSGYSNYEYFLSLPIDKIKLDGSLVKKVGEYRGFILIESIINFCKKCDIKVVAEFVEDEKTFNILKNLGVDYFQGHYFSEAKSLDELLKEKQ
ncbi:MAG: EAL domain-containing protein [Arcobacter sp.]|jgi:EAL domain-containing protein (putative c-di-GMP-specific phosphodiesterase class I)/CheY-like chemotaxis protein/GGDEF domain-containing protein|uniref:EAL domain-containing protein n=1 Tax=Arcobacter sp. TaxID=1872629 RepID=UPI002A763996|nr:EAL domain-containing protein [Arcobacter sp.]MDY3199438.1 EAL domain-containing protein [Arcobacter sp.]